MSNKMRIAATTSQKARSPMTRTRNLDHNLLAADQPLFRHSA